MTVSRVMNKENAVRPTTREKVERAISKLAYAPSPAARSLAGGEDIRISLLHSNPSASYLSALLVGSLDQASRSGIDLVVEKWDADSAIPRMIAHLLRGRINGVILPPPLCDWAAMRDALAAAGIIAVAVAAGRMPDDMSAVGIHDHDAANAMTRHLITLGHRRIGFIRGNPDQSASERRLDGYLAALNDAGILRDNGLIVPGCFTYRSGLAAAGTLLDLSEPPSAIFAANDDMAAAAIAVAHRRGLDVPRELTVCGFDDTALATIIWPELTTIRQPIGDMARRAVDLLVREIKERRAGQHPGSPQHILLDYTLIRRQSDDAPHMA